MKQALLDKINTELKGLDVDDVDLLTQIGAKIRSWIIEQELPKDLENEIRTALQNYPKVKISPLLYARQPRLRICLTPLCRSTRNLLNIRGIDNVLIAIKEVFASLYNDRAIAYRVIKALSMQAWRCPQAFSVWCVQKRYFWRHVYA